MRIGFFKNANNKPPGVKSVPLEAYLIHINLKQGNTSKECEKNLHVSG